ncbi:hypothetical protein [Candidatus Methylomirabilis sp.]|uniref:hypothetical protein n=1 Tax=Candidatus Methylomirabilis sp. TaxID=2032687 RepID=UPI002A5C20D3|nr:hypothetical protein [Candidatus Methylomirabilis sp.]
MSQDLATQSAGADGGTVTSMTHAGKAWWKRRPLQKGTLGGARGVQAGRAIAGT